MRERSFAVLVSNKKLGARIPVRKRLTSFFDEDKRGADPARIFYKDFFRLRSDQQAAAVDLGWTSLTWPNGEAAARWECVSWEDIDEAKQSSWRILGFDAHR